MAGGAPAGMYVEVAGTVTMPGGVELEDAGEPAASLAAVAGAAEFAGAGWRSTNQSRTRTLTPNNTPRPTAQSGKCAARRGDLDLEQRRRRLPLPVVLGFLECIENERHVSYHRYCAGKVWRNR